MEGWSPWIHMFWGGQFADHQHGNLGDLAAFHKRNAFEWFHLKLLIQWPKIKEQLPGSHAQSWVDEFFGLYKWKRTITYLVGGLEHVLFSISYMGCHPSQWRTHIFQRVGQPPTRYHKCLNYNQQHFFGFSYVWVIVWVGYSYGIWL